MNARQKEFYEQQKAFILMAMQWAHKYKTNDVYDAKIPKEAFLVEFGCLHHAGNSARLRYFNDFKTFGALDEEIDENTLKPTGYFKLDKEEFEKLAVAYGFMRKPQP